MPADPISNSSPPDVPPVAVTSRSDRRIRRLIGQLCFIALDIGLLITGIAVLLPLRMDRDFSWYDIPAAVVFFARVFPLPVAVVWLVLGSASAVCRRWAVAIACGMLAIGWATPEIWMAWPRDVVAPGPTFSVASANLNKELGDATWAATVMRKMDADIVVFQEVSPHSAEQLRTGLAGAYPYVSVYPDAGYNGMAVFSKAPITVQHAPDGDERRDLRVTTTALGRELVLVDMHLAPPQQTAKRRRNRWQVGTLLSELESETRPTLLAGDFNFTALTPQAFALRAAGFSDAHLQAGRGRAATWPAHSAHSIVPSVRIDTVYARGPLRAVGSEVGPDFGSDHLPIKTIWQWMDTAAR